MAEQAGNRLQYKNFVWNNERWQGIEQRDDDIIISTPPKCGTTWMQMQVALLLFRTPDLPAPLAKLSPWLDMNTRSLDELRADLDAQTHRRFIKTHTPLGGLPWRDSVTYLHVSRDPRDVALSWDNHMDNIDLDRLLELRMSSVGMDDLPELGLDKVEPPVRLDDPVDRFWHWVEGDGVAGSTSGLGNLVNHSRSFWEVRDRPNVHLFHYGDLRDDLAGQMTFLAEALGVDPPTEELVEAARCEQMKARSAQLAPNSDVNLWHSADQFFHKARSGEWRDLVGDDGLPRYEAAMRTATDDEELIAWLHGGWLR